MAWAREKDSILVLQLVPYLSYCRFQTANFLTDAGPFLSVVQACSLNAAFRQFNAASAPASASMAHRPGPDATSCCWLQYRMATACIRQVRVN